MSKYVKLAFVFTGILAWVLFSKLFHSLFQLVNPNWDRFLLGQQFTVSDLLGLLAGAGALFAMWFNERVNVLGLEIATELKRVTYPNWPETKTSTIVVIITTIVVSLILGLFDYIWASITSLIYGY